MLKNKINDTAKIAIQMLSEMPRAEKINQS
jgi:hypothetical protein